MHYRNKPVNPAMWVSGNRLLNFISLQEKTTHQLETLYSFSCAHKTRSPSPSSRIDLISWRPCLSLCCWACPSLPRAPERLLPMRFGIISSTPAWFGWGWQQEQGQIHLPRDPSGVSVCAYWWPWNLWVVGHICSLNSLYQMIYFLLFILELYLCAL